MQRRDFISLLAAAPFCYSRHLCPSESSAPRLVVAVDEPVGTINPRVYGQFTEHIGKVIYDGIWVGPDSKIPNITGLRTDTIEALKRAKASVVRWPGGCFADAYQWQDGVGPASQRPMRHNVWWLRDEPNTFGTDEYLEWCRLIGAEPFLTANVGTGSPGDALNWLEYCNGTGNGTYAQMRIRNGHREPYGVRLWGIGNENWGCGGLFSPTEYAHAFREYAVYFKRMGLSSDVDLVGVGSIEEDWNEKFLDAAGPGLPYLDYLSIHKYFRRGPSITFSDADYTSLMLDLTELESLIRTALAAMDEVEPRRAKYPVFGKMPRNKPIELVVDEWGVWHSDAVITDGFRESGTLRDAIFAASALNLFQQYPQRLTMSNIAQVTNCLHALILTDGTQLTLTPTFYVYEMFRDHQGAQSLRTELSNAAQMTNGQLSRPALSASASRSKDTVLITLANQNPNDGAELRMSLRGARASSATATTLTGRNVRLQNTVQEPQTVAPRPGQVRMDGDGLVAILPPGSVQAVRIQLG